MLFYGCTAQTPVTKEVDVNFLQSAPPSGPAPSGPLAGPTATSGAAHATGFGDALEQALGCAGDHPTTGGPGVDTQAPADATKKHEKERSPDGLTGAVLLAQLQMPLAVLPPVGNPNLDGNAGAEADHAPEVNNVVGAAAMGAATSQSRPIENASGPLPAMTGSTVSVGNDSPQAETTGRFNEALTTAATNKVPQAITPTSRSADSPEVPAAVDKKAGAPNTVPSIHDANSSMGPVSGLAPALESSMAEATPTADAINASAALPVPVDVPSSGDSPTQIQEGASSVAPANPADAPSGVATVTDAQSKVSSGPDQPATRMFHRTDENANGGQHDTPGRADITPASGPQADRDTHGSKDHSSKEHLSAGTVTATETMNGAQNTFNTQMTVADVSNSTLQGQAQQVPQGTAAVAPGNDLVVPHSRDDAAGAGQGRETANAHAPSALSTSNDTQTPPSNLPGPVGSARILDRAGLSEMHIGLRTPAFGSVEVHTVVREGQVGVSIGSERGDLRTYFGAEVPALQASLRQQDLHFDGIRFLGQSGATSQGFSAGTGQHAQPERHNTPVYAGTPPADTLERNDTQQDVAVQHVGLSVHA